MKKTTNKKIILYLLITFLITWVSFAIIIIANQFGYLAYGTVGSLLLMGPCVGCAPAIATALVKKIQGEIVSIKDFLKFVFDIKNLKKSLLIILIFFLFQTIVSLLIGTYNGTPIYMCLPLLPFMMIGGGFEEIGWRGYLQPLMEKKYPFFIATLLVGGIWAIWHLPLWFIEGSHQSLNWSFLIFTVFCIGNSFVLALLYKLTKSVFACVLQHAWINVILEVIMVDFKSLIVIIPLVIEVVIVCLIYYGTKKKLK